MKSCVYQILNTVTDKFYIGHSIDYDVRWWEHERKLKTNKHDNPYLQAAWNKYGKDAFEFILIELVPENEMLSREQYWIDKLGACDNQLGYNINPNALRPPSSKGKKRSAEARARISSATLGVPKTPHIRKARTKEHCENLAIARRNVERWPCPDGYDCNCISCKRKRNRMKNYPNIYGNPNSEFYCK